MGAQQSNLGDNFVATGDDGDDAPYFSMGNNTLKIAMDMHRDIRFNLCKSVRSDASYQPHSWMYFEGKTGHRRYDTDVNTMPFRQESFFSWLFGAKEPGLAGIISCDTGYSILFIPKPKPDSEVWSGPAKDPNWYKKHYLVDNCKYVEDLTTTLEERNVKLIYLMEGKNRFSGVTAPAPSFPGMEKFTVNKTTLYPIAVAGRVRKTDKELAVIRYVTQVSSEAHKKVMLAAKPGMMEYQASSIFQYYCYCYGGCREVGYIPICPGGDRCKILHYGGQGAPNDKKITDGSLCLFDMGAEYHCYLTDITTTFPVNGKFTPEQKVMYQIVYDTVQEVLNNIRPGFTWREARIVCYKTLLQKLVDYGLCRGDASDISDMYDCKLHRDFMPHGIGHFIGSDVHDVGGNASYWCWTDEQVKDIDWYDPDLEWCPLERNMVLTIEPGLYFNDVLLDPAIADPVKGQYINRDEVAKYRGLGGVRIEEVFIVTQDGYEKISHVPRTIDEIEEFMAGAKPDDIPFLDALESWTVISKDNFPMTKNVNS